MMRKSRIHPKVMYCLLMLLLSLRGMCAGVTSLLSQDVQDKLPLVQFQQDVSRSTDNLQWVRLYYMGARDCQTGYMGQYETDTRVFALDTNQKFSLTGAGVYQVGNLLFADERMPSVRAVLVLFIGKNRQVSRFLGTCSDALINCCIPVDCLQDEHACVPVQNMDLQHFNFGREPRS